MEIEPYVLYIGIPICVLIAGVVLCGTDKQRENLIKLMKIICNKPEDPPTPIIPTQKDISVHISINDIHGKNKENEGSDKNKEIETNKESETNEENIKTLSKIELKNPEFEHGMSGWCEHPTNIKNKHIIKRESPMYNSDNIFEPYGTNEYALKIWGANLIYFSNSPEHNNANNVFQEFKNLKIGTKFNLQCHMFTDKTDTINNSSNYVLLFAKYFKGGKEYDQIDIDSVIFDKKIQNNNKWVQIGVDCIVPKETDKTHIGIMFVQPLDEGGSVYCDNFKIKML